MTIKPLYLIIAAVAFIALAIHTIQITGSSNAKDDVIEKLESDAKDDLKELEAARKANADLRENLQEQAETDFEEGEALEVEKEHLKNPYYENEPYRINDADSLRIIIARRIRELKGN